MEGAMERDRVLATIAVSAGIVLALAAVLLFGCGTQSDTTTPARHASSSTSSPGPSSDAPPDSSGTQPSVPARLAVTTQGRNDMAEAAASNNAFSLELFRGIRSESKNLVCSPYSVTLALAMTMAGARGQTQAQMKQALQIDLPYYRVNRALNALDLSLTQYEQFSCADSIWGQTGRGFKEPFLNVLAQYYGAPLQSLDLDGDYAGACRVINAWVSDKTKGRINDLMSPEDAPPRPRLMMLVNAVHFKADWAETFNALATEDRPFFLLDGTKAEVPMMAHERDHALLQTEKVQAIQLPYEGERFAMVLIMPAEGTFEQFAERLDQKALDELLTELTERKVILRMPLFQITSTPPIVLGLQTLGMTVPFTSEADFSGMTDETGPFWITNVAQKAFIDVNEEGTEAAAATGVTMAGATSTTTTLPPVEMTVDHPFVYLIRDTQTGAILFIGQVMDPRQRG
jgi:serpin B